MKFLNQYIIEKLHINKNIKIIEIRPPKRATTCYDIGGGEHHLIDYAELDNLDDVNIIIDGDEVCDNYEKRALKRQIKNHKLDDYKYIVLVDQIGNGNYLALWGNKGCEWPIVCYEFKDNK